MLEGLDAGVSLHRSPGSARHRGPTLATRLPTISRVRVLTGSCCVRCRRGRSSPARPSGTRRGTMTWVLPSAGPVARRGRPCLVCRLDCPGWRSRTGRDVGPWRGRLRRDEMTVTEDSRNDAASRTRPADRVIEIREKRRRVLLSCPGRVTRASAGHQADTRGVRACPASRSTWRTMPGMVKSRHLRSGGGSAGQLEAGGG